MTMKCFHCSQEIPDDEAKKRIKCDICKNTFCIMCSGLSATEIRVMELTKRNLIFNCKPCGKNTNMALIIASVENTMKQLLDNTKSDLETKLAKLQNEIFHLKESNTQLVNLLALNKPTEANNPSYASAAKSLSINKEETVKQSVKPIKPPLEIKNQTVTSEEKRNKTNVNHNLANTLIDDNVNGHHVTDEEKFIPVKSNRKKRNFGKVGTANENEENISGFQGSAKSAADKKIWIFLKKVKDTANPTIIRDYMCNKLNAQESDIFVKKVDTYFMEKDKNCYLIGLNPTYKLSALKTEFWPKGVVFDRFNFRKGEKFLDHKPMNNEDQHEDF